MNDSDLLVRVYDTLIDYLALGNETFQAHGATFVGNRSTPRRYDANHVDRIRTSDPAEIEALLRRADQEFAGYAHRSFHVDPLTPAAFEARLMLDGGFAYVSQGLHLLLEGELQASPKPHDIREVRDESEWRSYALLLEMDLQEDSQKHNRTLDPTITPEWIAYLQAKSPAVRFWLAYVDEEPVAFFNSWPGANGIGQVEDLFTHLGYRHRGIATALIAHCVADARARGAGPVLISADPNDTPKHMYRALGFRPFSVSRGYVRVSSA